MGLPSLSCNAPYTVLFTVDTVTSQVAETSRDRVEGGGDHALALFSDDNALGILPQQPHCPT